MTTPAPLTRDDCDKAALALAEKARVLRTCYCIDHAADIAALGLLFLIAGLAWHGCGVRAPSDVMAVQKTVQPIASPDGNMRLFSIKLQPTAVLTGLKLPETVEIAALTGANPTPVVTVKLLEIQTLADGVLATVAASPGDFQKLTQYSAKGPLTAFR